MTTNTRAADLATVRASLVECVPQSGAAGDRKAAAMDALARIEATMVAPTVPREDAAEAIAKIARIRNKIVPLGVRAYLDDLDFARDTFEKLAKAAGMLHK